MKKERRILYKLVHKDMNKTGLAESISYGDFIPELDNKRQLYIKTKYGEDLIIKDEQVLSLEKVSENFIQLGKNGDKNVELSLMFLTKWKNHTDHYTLDGEISFDKLWEGVRPADFIPYLYSTKNNKNMVEFVSDLSVFTYDEEETDTANLITLHEKLRLLAEVYKKAYKHVAECVLDVYKKFFDIRRYVHIKGPVELFIYGKKLLDLSKVLLEANKIIKQGETKDFSGLLDKLEELELYPKVQLVDLTQFNANQKIKIKLLSDNKSPVVSNTCIYSTDVRADAVDACFVYHNRYGDIINGYKPSTPEVKTNGTGNNNITFEADGCIYLKGSYTYLIRSTASDLVVLKYDPEPITHYPLYNATEFSGVKSYQANTVLIGSKGNPYLLGNPTLSMDTLTASENIANISGYNANEAFTEYSKTELRELLQYYPRSQVLESNGYDLPYPLFQLSKAEDMDRVFYPNRAFSDGYIYKELGNKTGGDFVSRWYHGLISKIADQQADSTPVDNERMFFFPQLNKVSDIKVTSIATKQEYSYQLDSGLRKTKEANIKVGNLNKDIIFKEYLSGYNYGQGQRLPIRSTTTYQYKERTTSWEAMYSHSVYLEDKVYTAKYPNMNRNNPFSDPYTYRSSNKYYLEFREVKPRYPTLKFKSLKDGSVKYLAKKYATPLVTVDGNTVTISRQVIDINRNPVRTYIEIVGYRREFDGKEPDNTFDEKAFFSPAYGVEICNFTLVFSNINKVHSAAFRDYTSCKCTIGKHLNQTLDEFLNYVVLQNKVLGNKYTVFIRMAESSDGTNASNWIKIPVHLTDDSMN